MKKILLFAFLLSLISLASFATVMPIDAHAGVCVGRNLYLHDTTHGGTWSSSNTLVATIDAYGIVTGVSAGSATITYDVSGSYVTSPVDVDVAPALISGPTTLCNGSATTFTDATPGGTWVSYSTYNATVGSTSGIVSAIHDGSASISYYVLYGCFSSISLSIISTPSPSVVGLPMVCPGSSITLSDSTGHTGGAWSSSNTSVATVSSGLVSGVSVGTSTISYSYTDACGTATATMVVTVSSSIAPGAISGTTTLMAGSSAWLRDSYPYGTWTSSNTGLATIDPVYGTWIAVAAGTSTISYTISGCSGPVSATQAVTVNPYDCISGHVILPGKLHAGGVKVYLITYNPGTLMLQAYDSVDVAPYDSVATYKFNGVPTDSFRVKAAIDTSGGAYAYVPTYHTSDFYWYTATVFRHVSGTIDTNKDITMIKGTVPSGPGFIGGNVGTGANKGTSSGAAGLNIYAIDGGGDFVMTVTDASGDYAFNNMPLGTYEVFPEALNYITSPVTNVTLTLVAPSSKSVGFTQHTISHTITPNSLKANNYTSAKAAVTVFPNPASNRLNLLVNGTTKETGTVTIIDMAGREVYSETISIANGAIVKQIDMAGFANGTYIVNVNSASINYNGKTRVAH